MRGGHEEADVGVAGFVAAARERDVAEAGGLRGAEGGERRGGGGVVVFARGQRREVRWGVVLVVEAAEEGERMWMAVWRDDCGYRAG